MSLKTIILIIRIGTEYLNFRHVMVTSKHNTSRVTFCRKNVTIRAILMYRILVGKEDIAHVLIKNGASSIAKWEGSLKGNTGFGYMNAKGCSTPTQPNKPRKSNSMVTPCSIRVKFTLGNLIRHSAKVAAPSTKNVRTAREANAL